MNYRSPLSEDEWELLRPEMQGVFDSLMEAYPCLPETYSDKSHPHIPRFLDLRRFVHARLMEVARGRGVDLERELQSVLDHVVRGFASEGCCGDLSAAVHLLDDRETSLIPRAFSSDTERRHSQRYMVNRGEGIPSWVALRRKAIRIADFDCDANACFQRLHATHEHEIGSLLSAPIYVGSDLRGVITCDSTEANSFDADSTGYLCAVAEEIGLLIASVSQHELAARPGRRVASRSNDGFVSQMVRGQLIVDNSAIIPLPSSADATEGVDMEGFDENAAHATDGDYGCEGLEVCVQSGILGDDRAGGGTGRCNEVATEKIPREFIA